MHCRPKPHGVMQTTIIENPGLILLHDYHHIAACLPISDWQAACPEYPLDQFEADYWDRLGFDMRHDAPVALFIDGKRKRMKLTGVGLLMCAISLKAEADSFNVEEMVERILGKYSDDWHEGEGFLDTTVPYLAKQSGTFGSTIPGDNSERRAYLSPRHERAVQGEFWEAVVGPVGCGGQMPGEWRRMRDAYLDRLNLRAGQTGD